MHSQECIVIKISKAQSARCVLQGRMHLAWDYLHMVADNGNVSLLELRERIYNTGSAEIPQDAAPPVLPYQQESIVPQAPPAGDHMVTPMQLIHAVD